MSVPEVTLKFRYNKKRHELKFPGTKTIGEVSGFSHCTNLQVLCFSGKEGCSQILYVIQI